jgi:hypothetical protein
MKPALIERFWAKVDKNGPTMPHMRTEEYRPRGEKNVRAKLTAADVLVIRDRCAAGEQQKDVALDYPVDKSQIGRIVRREIWAHVEG